MYQEQQYFTYQNPNPGDNPPPPGTDSFTYQPYGVGNFGAMTSIASAYMHPAGNSGVVTPPMTNNVTVTTMQPGITQPVQCEVCNITCHTADVLETHKLGKKHLKNVQKQAVTSAIAQNMPSLTPASAPLVGKLEDKWHRILQNGASVDTLLHCDLCNVVCNNENAFQGHVASKKHLAKAIMQRAGTGKAGTGEVGTGEAGTGEAGRGEAGTGEASTGEAGTGGGGGLLTPTSEGGGGLLTPTSEGGGNPQPLSSNVFPCELCKISCTSKELLDLHISGKKHQKKLKDSVQVSDPVEATTIISNEVKPASCEICGISCDTYEVLKTHLTGRKHLKNLEKSQKPSVPHNPVPTSEPVSTPAVVERVATPTVVERVATPTVVEPVSTLKVVEPVSTPKVVEPASTPKVVEPVSTPNVVEPFSTPAVVEPAVSTPAVVEPVSTPKVVEPVSTPKVVEVLQDSLQKDDKIVVSHEVKPTCEICGISCDTNEMLNIHFTGRKHQKNVRKLEKPSVPHKPVSTTDDGGEIATPMVVGQLQDSLKDDKIVNEGGSIRKGKRAASRIDLETKKQKIMEVGTAPASLRACTVCNIVCNSPTAFDYHMAGQKHHAMVAKQAKAQ